MSALRGLGVTGSLGVLAFAWACGGAPESQAPQPCGLAPQDSVFLAGGPVFPACGVEREAHLIDGTAREDFRPSVLPNPGTGDLCFTAEVRVVVGADGRVEPGTARLLRASDAAFGRAVMDGVPSWRYRPAQRAGEDVRQVVIEKRLAAIRARIVGQGRDTSPPRC